MSVPKAGFVSLSLSISAGRIRAAVLAGLFGLVVSACGPSPTEGPPADSSSTPSRRLDLEVVNNDFEGQSGISIISHEQTPVTVSNIVVNDGRDASCVFAASSVLHEGDGSALPTKLLPGQWRHTDRFSPKVCGEPAAVTVTTDLGVATYPVSDPDDRALGNELYARPAGR